MAYPWRRGVPHTSAHRGINLLAFIPIPNTAKILVQGLYFGQQVENVFYAKQGAPYDASSLAVLADAVSTWQLDPFSLQVLPTDFEYTGVKCISMEDDSGLNIEVPLTGDFGIALGAPLPNNVSLAIHKVSSVGGRHGKGRVYHPGLTASFMEDANTVASGYAAHICEMYRNLRDVVAAIAGGATVLGYAELVDGGAPLAIGVFIQILDFACKDRTVDSQRRRLPGRGR